MERETLLAIAERINQVAKNDDVHVKVNLNPELHVDPSSRVRNWQIELIHKNYHYVEGFNDIMNIDVYDVDNLAGILLANLFDDYFHAKLKLKLSPTQIRRVKCL